MINHFLDYIYTKKETDQFGGVCPSIHSNNFSGMQNVAMSAVSNKLGGRGQIEESKETYFDKFCIKHP